ncbi:hypothetical protein D3C73_1183800 [compost metagenome]
MCRVGMVAVGPDASGLNTTSHLVGQITVTAPDAGPQSVLGIVGDLQRVVHSFKGCDRQHRAEDLFLENAHIVLAVQDGWLEVVALF